MRILTRLLESPSHFQVGAVMSLDLHTMQLLLRIPCITPSGTRRVLDVLIDTGAQANLVRRGLFSNLEFGLSSNPISMVTAGGVPLEGGREEVKLTMIFTSTLPGVNGRSRTWKESAHFYDAAISVDVIVGYRWLRSRRIGVLPHLDALAMFDCDGLTVRILRPPSPSDSVINLVRSADSSEISVPTTSDSEPPSISSDVPLMNSEPVTSPDRQICGVVRRLMDLGNGQGPFESYRVRPQIFKKIVQKLRTGPPDVDAFAESALHFCDYWWGPGSVVSNAFDVPIGRIATVDPEGIGNTWPGI